MIRKEIRELLADRRALGPSWSFLPEELAVAALMVRCACTDGDFADEERQVILRAVREEFNLDEWTAEWAVQVAEMGQGELWINWPISDEVKLHFKRDEQLAVIRRLWEVALADGTVHPCEERFVARIARELGIPKEAVAKAAS
jgi:uncharacterized tellurite resistance protein B-like protein